MSPDEGRIQAYLDNELGPADRSTVEDRVRTDPAWADALAELRANASLFSDHLSAGDEPAPSHTPPAWIRVLARQPETAGDARSMWPRAAAIILLAAGATVSGLPGSPVRAWLIEAFGGTPEATVAAVPGPDASTPGRADEVGVRIPVPTGRLEVDVTSIASGEGLTVEWTEAGEPGVFGAADTQFRTSAGRVEILGSARRLRVELPRSLTQVRISVAGRAYLIKNGTTLELSGPVTEQSEARIEFSPQP